jgi:hypothetical protein
MRLGGYDDLVTAGKVPDRPAGYFLGGAAGIDIGRIEEIDARLNGAAQDRAARFLVEDPLVPALGGVAEAHAAKA